MFSAEHIFRVERIAAVFGAVFAMSIHTVQYSIMWLTLLSIQILLHHSKQQSLRSQGNKPSAAVAATTNCPICMFGTRSIR